ncbi:MAG: ROK family protein [Marinifilaceae bacterium]
MKNIVLGVDIGRTNIRFGGLNLENDDLLPFNKIKFQAGDSAYAELSQNIFQGIRNYLNSTNLSQDELVGIGVSLPALFNRDNGQILRWPNNRLWDGLNFMELLSKEFDVPIVMEDDANSAALGESLIGKAVGCDNYVYVTISSGIGCGIIINGEIYHGTSGWAGELGHTISFGVDMNCSCGNKGCIQACSSGVAIYNSIMDKLDAKDREIYNELEEIIKDKNCNYEIEKIIERAAIQISYSIFNMNMILDLPLIIIGGGVVKIGSIFTIPLIKNLNTLFGNIGRTCNIELANDKNENGVYGSMMLIKKRILEANKIPSIIK